MICLYCGKSSEAPGAVTCPYCGAPLPPQGKKEKQTPSRRFHPVLAFCLLFFLMLLPPLSQRLFASLHIADNAIVRQAESPQVKALLEDCIEPANEEDETYTWPMTLFFSFLELPESSLSTEDYRAVSSFYKSKRFSIFAVATLNLARLRDGQDHWFDEMEKACSVKTVIEGYTSLSGYILDVYKEPAQKTYETIFQKPVASISWREMCSIKYVRQTGGEFIYSFQPPEAFISRDDFESQLKTVKLSDFTLSRRWNFGGPMCTPLFGCEAMEVNCYNQYTILAKPLRSFTGYYRYTDKKNRTPSIKWFQLTPYLEKLDLLSPGILTDGMERLQNLKTLILRDKTFATTGGPYKDEISLNNLPASLQSLQLVKYKPVGEIASSNQGGMREMIFQNCDLTKTEDFLNGFSSLITLEINNCNLSSLESLSGLQNLQALTLLKNSSVFPPDKSASFPKLTKLVLDSKLDLTYFPSCPNLRELTIGNSTDLNRLSAYPELTFLTLAGKEQTYQLEALPILPKLTGLSAAPENEKTILSRIINLPVLSKFPVFQTLRLEKIKVNDLDSLLKSDKLHTLTLRALDLYIDPDAFRSCHNLRTLIIQDMRLDTPETQKLLTAVGTLKNLSYLDFSNTKLESLEFLRGMTGLHTFIARNNYISDNTVLRTLPELMKFDLSDNLLEEAQ